MLYLIKWREWRKQVSMYGNNEKRREKKIDMEESVVGVANI